MEIEKENRIFAAYPIPGICKHVRLVKNEYGVFISECALGINTDDLVRNDAKPGENWRFGSALKSPCRTKEGYLATVYMNGNQIPDPWPRQAKCDKCEMV